MIYPPKRCKYCKALFNPTQRTQDFCQPAHRKAYWQYGALNWDKFADRIEKKVRQIVREEMAAVEAERLRNVG